MDDVSMVKGLTERNLLVLVSCVFLGVYLSTETRQKATLAIFSAKNLLSYSLLEGFQSAAYQEYSRRTRSLCPHRLHGLRPKAATNTACSRKRKAFRKALDSLTVAVPSLKSQKMKTEKI
ncbi:hypothetical protein LI328DRAFT_162584 [Trichoderma asperelloides]|nr:hypothetical protein LI328DRAFT_162584 [Trichoderma asperelloides]